MVGRVRLSSVSPLPDAIHKAKGSAESCGEFPAEFPVDLHRFRAVFPDRWAALLRHHFNGDLLRIQTFFGVSERTARDWLGGVSAPAGPFVALACVSIPGATGQLTRVAA